MLYFAAITVLSAVERIKTKVRHCPLKVAVKSK